MSDRILVHIDPDLSELIPGFLANRARDVTNMRAALATRQFDSIRVAGHSMKGAGGGYGFDRITAIGADLEKAALAEDVDALAAGIEALADYLERIDIVYDGES